MSWINEIQLWNTLFELNENHQNLGLKGEIFFAYDFPQELSTGEVKTCISYTAFSGMHLGKGISSFLVTDKELEKYFQPIQKTFKQLQDERQQEYINN